jgi:hypothetical protein
MKRTTDHPPPGKPNDPADPAVPHSGEGADSALDALRKKRIPPAAPSRDEEKKT